MDLLQLLWTKQLALVSYNSNWVRPSQQKLTKMFCSSANIKLYAKLKQEQSNTQNQEVVFVQYNKSNLFDYLFYKHVNKIMIVIESVFTTLFYMSIGFTNSV